MLSSKLLKWSCERQQAAQPQPVKFLHIKVSIQELEASLHIIHNHTSLSLRLNMTYCTSMHYVHAHAQTTQGSVLACAQFGHV